MFFFISCYMGSAEDGFCYWDARNEVDVIILLCNLAVSVGVLVVTLCRLNKANRFGDGGRRIARIYTLIILWSVTFCFQMVLGTSVYLTKIIEDGTLDMDNYSRTYARLDTVPAIIITTIFLSICKLFFKGLMGSVEVKQMQKWEIKFMSVVRIYYYTRMLVLAVCLLVLNMFVQTEKVKIFLSVTVDVLILDCFFSSIVLIFSLRIFIVRFGETNRFEQNDLKRLKREYVVMIIASVFRIANALLFVILPLQLDTLSSQRCIQTFEENQWRTILFNGVGNLFNHLLPILWILKIYNISSFERSLNQRGEESQRDESIASYLRVEE